MSDRSYLTLIVTACATEVRDAADIVIADAGLGRGSGDAPGAGALGKWVVEEASLGEYEEIGGKLVDATEGQIAFAIWNDPKYEVPGGLMMHSPNHGDWFGNCDSQGVPSFLSPEVALIVAEPDEEKRLRMMGTPWLREFEQGEGIIAGYDSEQVQRDLFQAAYNVIAVSPRSKWIDALQEAVVRIMTNELKLTTHEGDHPRYKVCEAGVQCYQHMLIGGERCTQPAIVRSTVWDGVAYCREHVPAGVIAALPGEEKSQLK